MLKREIENFEIRKKRYVDGKSVLRMRVAVVKGLPAAERMVARLMRERTQKEKEAVWRFSCYRTTDAVSI